MQFHLLFLPVFQNVGPQIENMICVIGTDYFKVIFILQF